MNCSTSSRNREDPTIDPTEIAAYLAFLEQLDHTSAIILPVGKGLSVACREAPPSPSPRRTVTE